MNSATGETQSAEEAVVADDAAATEEGAEATAEVSESVAGLVELANSLQGASYNEAAPDWTEYESLISQIKSETDYANREALMHQAEDILMATGAVLPIYYYNDIYMLRDGISNIYSNLYGFKYFMYAEGVEGGVLNANLASEPAKLDPALNSSVDGACLAVNSFAGLYTYDANGELQPALADSYTVSDDGLVYTITMKEGLKWSDGSDLTANDIVYSWKRAAADETAADYAYMFDNIKDANGEVNVVADDDHTLTVTLGAPCAYFLDLMAFPAFYPVQQAAVESAADWEANPGAWCQEAGFVSSGAYVLKEWTHDESMVYVKNPYYYDAENVTVDELHFMLSADDTAIFSAYNAGDVDFIDSVPTDAIASLLENSEFYIVPNLGTYYAAFNVNSELFAGKTATQAALMRIALTLLIDRDYIVQNIGQTGQEVATAFIPAGMLDGNGGVFKTNDDAYTYPNADTTGYFTDSYSAECVEDARILLEMAGYEFDENGMLSESTPISLNYLTNDGTGHIKVAEAMQQDFAELGIEMTITSEEWNVFLDDRKAGNFDFAREGWLADFNDPINMLEMWTAASGNNDCQFGRE
ncbi:MAG: peptide ABC transporter substrate-binding protein [Lachnospiraceae bacterium]|nr:peptide ABC transporter substrate-binding protein [Lachnospiraceae bacterium]